jgi:hypothetical protein
LIFVREIECGIERKMYKNTGSTLAMKFIMS